MQISSNARRENYYVNNQVICSDRIGSDTKYEIIKSLGSGAFGETYKAKVIKNPKKGMVKEQYVAIKFIKNNRVFCNLMGVGGDPLNEINKLVSIGSHLNIVKYLDSFYSNEKIHIVMEYCNEGTLESIFEKSNFDDGDVVKWCKDIFEGLNYIHQSNYVHLDLKLDNILLCNGIVKIGDFGLMREIPSDYNFLETIHPGGAIVYRSPEQLKGKKVKLSNKCDVWSAGLMILELIKKQRVSDLGIITLQSNRIKIDEKILNNLIEECIREYPLLGKVLEGSLQIESKNRSTASEILKIMMNTSIYQKYIILKNNNLLKDGIDFMQHFLSHNQPKDEYYHKRFVKLFPTEMSTHTIVENRVNNYETYRYEDLPSSLEVILNIIKSNEIFDDKKKEQQKTIEIDNDKIFQEYLELIRYCFDNHENREEFPRSIWEKSQILKCSLITHSRKNEATKLVVNLYEKYANGLKSGDAHKNSLILIRGRLEIF